MVNTVSHSSLFILLNALLIFTSFLLIWIWSAPLTGPSGLFTAFLNREIWLVILWNVLTPRDIWRLKHSHSLTQSAVIAISRIWMFSTQCKLLVARSLRLFSRNSGVKLAKHLYAIAPLISECNHQSWWGNDWRKSWCCGWLMNAFNNNTLNSLEKWVIQVFNSAFQYH